MNAKLLLKIFLTIALFAMVTGCGGDTPEPEPAPAAAPTEVAVAQAPVEAQAPAAGFTPSSKCIVPDVVGLDIAVAESSLAGAGLQPLKDFRHDESVAENAIISQEPAAGTTLEPCEGDVVIVVSLGAVPVPTETPGPTETPAPPTETPIPTPVPPTATPTPDPRLFFDDFETGIRPEWNFLGETFSVTNGKLVLDGSVEGFVGDDGWNNYMVIFHKFAVGWGNMKILFRIQDRDNYMLFECNRGAEHLCGWHKVINGEAKAIPGTEFWAGLWDGHTLRFEMDGQIYRTFINTEQQGYFVDDTFSNGGFGLRYTGDFSLEGVEVRAMP